MRELESLISGWRRSLADGSGSEAAEEMEDHLRELIAEFTRAGMAEREAFNAAVAQMGKTKAISAEFAKLDDAGGVWRPIRGAIIFQAIAAIMLAAFLPIRLHDKPLGLLLGAHIFAVTMGYGAGFVVGSLGICFVGLRSFGELPEGKLRRIARQTARYAGVAAGWTAIGTLLAMVWAKLSWGRAWAWDPKEVGAFCVLVWTIGVFVAGRAGFVSARLVMLLAVLTNVVVAWAWFGAGLESMHGYANGVRVMLWATTVVHGGLFCVGLAPGGWIRMVSGKKN